MSAINQTITPGGVQAVDLASASISLFGKRYITATLNSSAGGRKIELSTNGGVEYFTPSYDINSATMLVAVILGLVTHIKFTGATSDTWSIL